VLGATTHHNFYAGETANILAWTEKRSFVQKEQQAGCNMIV